MDDDESHRTPGTDLVPLDGAHGLPRELAVAADLALGAAARTLRLARWLALAGGAAARGAASLPVVEPLARGAAALARPLAEDGARARTQGA